MMDIPLSAGWKRTHLLHLAPGTDRTAVIYASKTAIHDKMINQSAALLHFLPIICVYEFPNQSAIWFITVKCLVYIGPPFSGV